MSALPTEIEKPSPWRLALPALAVLLVAIGLMFRDTIAVMVDIWWRSETFAHCMLVVPMALWLVWRKRFELGAMTPKPQPWTLVAMLPVAAFWLVSQMAVVNAASQFAVVTLMILAVPAVLGLQVAHKILFPLLFLYFGVPFGEFMLPPMMEWTADFTVWALRATGIPVFREGQNFVIPSGHWSVIDECSGVRYVMASFLVGSLFAYLNYRSYRKRAVFMLVALLLPVLANWFRAYMIVMLGHLSGNRLAVGVDHILYGWVFFGLIVFGMFSVGSRWADADEPAAAPTDGAAHAAVPSGLIWGAAVGALLVALTPHVVLSALARSEKAAAPVTLDLPAQLAGGWTSEAATMVPFTPVIENPSREAAKVYTGRAGTVALHVAYFRGQDKDRKLVNSQHLLVAMRDRGWALPVHGSATAMLGGQQTRLRSSEILTRDTGSARRTRLQLWRLYWVDGRFHTGDAWTKLAGVGARLRGHGDEGALVLMYTVADSPEAGHSTLSAFLQANEGPLNDLLKKTQAAR